VDRCNAGKPASDDALRARFSRGIVSLTVSILKRIGCKCQHPAPPRQRLDGPFRVSSFHPALLDRPEAHRCTRDRLRLAIYPKDSRGLSVAGDCSVLSDRM